MTKDSGTGESCSGGIRISAEKGISWRANCRGFCSGGIQNMQSTSGNQFFCSCDILFTQSTMWVLCLAHFSISLACQATLYHKTFDLTLNKSAKVPLCLLHVLFPAKQN
jgi:hypothetical protein